MWAQLEHHAGHHTISNDQHLQNEQCLFSNNGHFFLKCQGDGKICLYRAGTPANSNGAHFYWQNTAQQQPGNGPFSLKVQNDGNLCLYNGGGQCAWSSNTWQQNPHAPYHLTVQNDGNVTYSDNTGHVLWEAKNQPGFQHQQPIHRHHILECDFHLLNESVMFSPQGHYFVKMQGDGKICVYKAGQPFNSNGANFQWQNDANQHGDGPFKLKIQGDGNLVIYNGHGQAKWDNKGWQQNAHAPYSLHMQDDGNLVVYDGQGQAKWACK